ncbi:hypothetical protein DNK49_22800, partial [Azoarcus communis]
MSTLLAEHGLVVPNPFKPEAPTARVSVFVTDHLGTPLRLVDHNGKTRWAAQPDDWAAVSEENGVRQPIRFQGQWIDEESGLYYNRYRYYDPGQSHLHVITPSSSARNLSDVAASMRLVFMLPLRDVFNRRR